MGSRHTSSRVLPGNTEETFDAVDVLVPTGKLPTLAIHCGLSRVLFDQANPVSLPVNLEHGGVGPDGELPSRHGAGVHLPGVDELCVGEVGRIAHGPQPCPGELSSVVHALEVLEQRRQLVIPRAAVRGPPLLLDSYTWPME